MHLKIYWCNQEAPEVLWQLADRGFPFLDTHYATRWTVAYFEIPSWALIDPDLVALLNSLPGSTIWEIG